MSAGRWTEEHCADWSGCAGGAHGFPLSRAPIFALLPMLCALLCAQVSSSNLQVPASEGAGQGCSSCWCLCCDFSQKPGFRLSSDPAAATWTSLLTCSELLALPSTSVPAHNFWFSSLHSFVLLNETPKEKIPVSSAGGSVRSAVTLILIPAPPREALGAGSALGAPPVFYRHALKSVFIQFDCCYYVARHSIKVVIYEMCVAVVVFCSVIYQGEKSQAW